MRAVVEHYTTDADSFPPIHVTLCKGKEDLSIKASYEFLIIYFPPN